MIASEVARSQAKSEERVLHERVKQKLEGMPPRYRGKFTKAISGRSVKAAVHSYCAECVGWEDVAHEVRNCTVPDCPFRPWRPYQQHPKKGTPGRSVVRQFCLRCMGFDTDGALSLSDARRAGEDIRDCPSALCPVYRYRPFQRRSS